MTKSTRLIITAAALAGLYSGSLALQARADDSNAGTPAAKDEGKPNSCSGKSSCNGKEKDKACCKAKASCKSDAGCKDCKNPDAGQAGAKADKDKSSCSGKDGCSAKSDTAASKDGK
ncbi:MAG: hypothetical protein WC485_10850 [Opitutaceae bacterium]